MCFFIDLIHPIGNTQIRLTQLASTYTRHFHVNTSATETTMKINFVILALVLLACCHLSLSQRSTKKPTTKKPSSKTAKPTKKGATGRPGPSKLSCDQSTALKFFPLDENKEILANPERGYYRHHEIKLAKYKTLGVDEMKLWAKKGVTLALMIFNIEQFVKKDLTKDALENISADFKALRTGGMKGIVRFSYNQTNIEDPDTYNFPKTTDAEKSQLLNHIKQLTPIFKDHFDVINVVQIGFIGHWGEWYFSRNYATEKKGVGWKPNPQQQKDREEIVKALMEAVPKSRMLQIRYPAAKQKLYGNTNMKPGGERTSNRARLGIHNDCFLAKEGDQGTFETGNKEKEAAQRKWLEDEGLSVMVGGESCEKNSKTGCTEAKNQIEKQRFTYLNTDFKETVVADWVKNKCYNYIGNKIGYRFELVKGSLQSTVKKGEKFCLSLDIKNSGVAPLYNERPLEIILRNANTKGSKSVKSIPYEPKVDPRKFLPGKTTSMKVSVQVPSELSPGQYDVIVNLPDGSPTLKDDAKYRILFANGGKVQDKTNRFNIIGQIIIQ